MAMPFRRVGVLDCALLPNKPPILITDQYESSRSCMRRSLAEDHLTVFLVGMNHVIVRDDDGTVAGMSTETEHRDITEFSFIDTMGILFEAGEIARFVLMQMPVGVVGRGSKYSMAPTFENTHMSSIAQSTAPCGPLISPQFPYGVPIHS
jgi:hypothetical protein